MDNRRVAMVFTFKSVAHIVRDGGTQAWRMDERRLDKLKFVVCTRNRFPRNQDGPEGPEPHGCAFLVGKVRDVVPTTDPEAAGKPFNHYLIRISEAAIIDIPHAWGSKPGKWRTPVRYFQSLAELGIDPTAVAFKPLSELASVPKHVLTPATQDWRECVDAAKSALAARLGVHTNAIGLTIKF